LCLAGYSRINHGFAGLLGCTFLGSFGTFGSSRILYPLSRLKTEKNYQASSLLSVAGTYSILLVLAAQNLSLSVKFQLYISDSEVPIL